MQFSDGVFTVALTLLVVDLSVPDLASGFSEADLQRALEAQFPNVLAFLLTFWVVAAYWLTHHRHFRLIHRYDGRLLLLNLVFLMTIVFIPWPTAVVGPGRGSLAHPRPVLLDPDVHLRRRGEAPLRPRRDRGVARPDLPYGTGSRTKTGIWRSVRVW